MYEYLYKGHDSIFDPAHRFFIPQYFRSISQYRNHILTFRNLKKNTDEALALYSDKNATETIFLAPYEDYVEQFAELTRALHVIAPTLDAFT